MHQDWQVESWEEEHVNLHSQLANCLFAIFGCPEEDWVAQGAFRVGMASDHGVGWLYQTGGGAPVPLRLQHVCGFLAVPFWEGRPPSVWFWRIIARGLSITAFTVLCPGNSTPHFVSSLTSARGFSIRYCVSSLVVRKNPPVAILAIFNAMRMSDCSSCTQPPGLASVADMLKTYTKWVAGSSNETGQLPSQCMLP